MKSTYFNFITLAISAGLTLGITAYFISYKKIIRRYGNSKTSQIIAFVTAIVIFISFAGSMLLTDYLIKK